jgi:DNA-binding response OmpR family regulator
MAHILVVEDDQFLRDLYQDILSQENYQITTVVDGEEAIAAIRKGMFDLVLLDIMMPKKDGIAVLKELSADDKKRAGQIVMLTNLGQEALIKEASESGAVGYLIKSAMAPDQVLTEVRNFLAANRP